MYYNYTVAKKSLHQRLLISCQCVIFYYQVLEVHINPYSNIYKFVYIKINLPYSVVSSLYFLSEVFWDDI